MSVLLENFDLLASSPGGVSKLRELILSLAVRGQLVPQDPNDEPASVLLQKIRAEKDRLIKEGKIKRDKPLAEIAEDEKPYELPDGWAWSSLGQIGLISPRNDAPDNLATSFVQMSSIPARFGEAHLAEERPWCEIKSGFTHFAENDIGVAKITPCFENGKSTVFRGLANGIGAGTTELHIVRPICGVNPDYILLFLKTPDFLIAGEQVMTGSAGQKRLPRQYFEARPFPIPPLAEQSRIVAKVEELMALCDRLEAEQDNANRVQGHWTQVALDQLSESSDAASFQRNWQHLASHWDQLFTTPESIVALEATLLQLAVRGKLVAQDPNDQPASELLKQIRIDKDSQIAEGKIKRDKPLLSITDDEKPFTVAEGWVWARFGDITNISSGVTLGRKTPIKNPVSLPYLRVANVQRWRLVLNDVKEVVIDEGEIERFSLKDGDLLITEGGDWDKVGRTCVWQQQIGTCLHQNHVFKVRKVFSGWMPRWAELYLNSADARAYFASSAKQTTNLASINMTQLKNSVFPLPSLAEQARIVAQVEKLLTITADLKSRLAAAQEASARLLNAAMDAALNPASAKIIAFPSHAEREARRIAVGCYAIHKLADKRYFGRTAEMKLLYLADAHVGLQLGIEPERKQAGPLDPWIYEFERLAAVQGWFSTVESDSGGKVTYQAGAGLQAQADKAAGLFAAGQCREFDRLLDLFADKTTEEAEIIATLFAAWNDFLIDGLPASNDAIITEVRENWHPAKARFAPKTLVKWLAWMRENKLVPRGLGPRTLQQGLLPLH